MRILPILLLWPVAQSSWACTHPGTMAAATGAGPGASGQSGADPRGLYAKHCAVCHGVDGDGMGPAAPHLFPAARDFGRREFRLVSTANGVPSEQDLVSTLRRGIPGSGMPSWDWLPVEDLRGLARHVRALAIEGMARRAHAAAVATGSGTSIDEARQRARRAMTPGQPLAVPPSIPARESDLALGAELFAADCAGCHGADGTGSAAPLRGLDGSLDWPRDFTAGYLKGGGSQRDLFLRIRAGMPGTPMPASQRGDRELAALVAHVAGLLAPDTGSRLVQRRETLRVRRVPTPVPSAPEDPRWEASEALTVRLAPLWWRDDSVTEARLAALHDGATIAIRVSWLDETTGNRFFADSGPTDAIALQLSASPTPPLFGMGAPDAPTTLWHWQALAPDELTGWLDLADPGPHGRALGGTGDGEVYLDAPLYRRIEDQRPPSEQVASSRGEGVERARSRTRRPSDVEVRVHAWESGWEVVFLRALESPVEREITFRPGTTVQAACAVWNGAAGDAGAQKAISIWQELALEP